MTYYPYWYRLGGADAYLLWYTDVSADGTGPDGTGPDGTGPDGTGPDGTGPDGVVLDAAGRVVTFRHLDDLRDDAARRGLAVEPDVNPEPLDLDAVDLWLAAARKTTVDCGTFLNAWDLFSDLASTVRGGTAHIDGQREGGIYDKLFWGNNLPAVTPPGKHYEPIWSKSEVGRMRNVLAAGMRLFRDRLGPSSAAGLGILEFGSGEPG